MKKTGLADKVVLITGGAAGIGRATALRFAAEGARVVAWDMRPEAPGFAEELVAAGAADAIYDQVDVQDEAAVEAAVARRWNVVRPDRRAGQQRRHHPRQPAGQVEGRRGRSPGWTRRPSTR